MNFVDREIWLSRQGILRLEVHMLGNSFRYKLSTSKRVISGRFVTTKERALQSINELLKHHLWKETQRGGA